MLISCVSRLPPIRISRLHIRCRDDLQGCPGLRQEEPSCLPGNLLPGRLCVRHVRQGLRHRAEAHLCREQPVLASLYLRLHDRHGGLHLDADELLQQGTQPIPD
jgi:hypothetical protein